MSERKDSYRKSVIISHELKQDWESLSRTLNQDMADSWYWVLEQAAHTWACWQMEHSSRSGGAGLSWTPDPSSRRSRGGSTWRQHSVTTQEKPSDFHGVFPDSANDYVRRQLWQVTDPTGWTGAWLLDKGLICKHYFNLLSRFLLLIHAQLPSLLPPHPHLAGATWGTPHFCITGTTVSDFQKA